MNKKIRRPALPAARTADKGIKDLLDGLREQVLRWRGDTGTVEEQVVTVGDLKDSGVAELAPGARAGVGTPIQRPASDPVYRVGALSGLQATGAFEIVILTWSGTNQRHYAHTEIWRNTSDDLGTAVKRGAAIAAEVFRDQADRDQTYYYWVRGVSTSGESGPFNTTAGTQAQTSASPDAVRDAISSTTWQASTTYQTFAVVRPTTQEITIDGVPVSFQAISGGMSGTSEPDWQANVVSFGDTVSDGSVTWEAIDAGQAPLLIGTRNGNPVVVMLGAVMEEASIGTAKIKDLAAEKINAGTISVALTLEAASITGGSLSIGGSGGSFTVNSDGSFSMSSASTGARVEQTTAAFKVFDSNGTKRVQIGDLSA